MMHPIHEDLAAWTADGRKAWCGPTALSVLTGMTLASAHSQVAFVDDKSLDKVRGMFPASLILLLNDAGYDAKPMDMTRWSDTECGPTLRRFFNELSYMDRAQTILVVTETHFLCTNMGYALDAWTKRPVPCKDFPKLGRLVNDAYIVTKR